jgi:hypothetical protein
MRSRAWAADAEAIISSNAARAAALSRFQLAAECSARTSRAPSSDRPRSFPAACDRSTVLPRLDARAGERSFLCVFGRESHIMNLALDPDNFDEHGTPESRRSKRANSAAEHTCCGAKHQRRPLQGNSRTCKPSAVDSRLTRRTRSARGCERRHAAHKSWVPPILPQPCCVLPSLPSFSHPKP